MKILMIVSDMERFRTHRAPLAKAIAAQGFGLDVAARGAAGHPALKDPGANGHDLPDGGHAGTILAIRRIIARSSPDIVHAVTLRQAFYTALAMCFLRPKIPAVYTIAGLGSLFATPTWRMRLLRPLLIGMLRRFFLQENVRLIFQNEENRRTMINLGMASPENAHLIRGSGVDIRQFSLAPEPETDRPVILFAGRLLKDKGVREFIEAARIVRGKNIAAHFMIAGDFYPQNPHSLDPALMRRWAGEGAVEWHGPSADMVSAIRACTLAVLPSYHEGLPKFLLEAAATGRAIVASDIPGCRDVVEDGANGLLVPVRDVSALAEAIEKLLADPERRRAMGAVGRKMVEREFTAERIAAETLAVYDRLRPDKG